MKVLAVAILAASVALAACVSSNGSPDTATEPTSAATAAPATALTRTDSQPSTAASAVPPPPAATGAPETGGETPPPEEEPRGAQQQTQEDPGGLSYLLETIGVLETPSFTEDVMGRLESLAYLAESFCEEWVESVDLDSVPPPECQQAYADMCQAMNETSEYEGAPEIWEDAARMVCLTARMVSSDIQVSQDTVDCLFSSSPECEVANRAVCEDYAAIAEELEYLSEALPLADLTEDYVSVIQEVRDLLCLGWTAR